MPAFELKFVSDVTSAVAGAARLSQSLAQTGEQARSLSQRFGQAKSALQVLFSDSSTDPALAQRAKTLQAASAAESAYQLTLTATREKLALGQLAAADATSENRQAISDYLARLLELQQTLPAASTAFQLLAVRILAAQAALAKTTVFGNVRLQLTGLVNQWSDAATQMGNWARQTAATISSTVGDAISGLIFRTTTWQASVAQAARSIVGSLIQIGVQMLIAHTLGRALNNQAVQQQVASGAQIAIANAPAAAATSVASYGTSAVVGAALAGAAIAAIIALLVGAFAGGGLIPGAASYRDNRLAAVATGEYIVRTAAVNHYGVGLLHSINSLQFPLALPAYAAGGLVSASAAAWTGLRQPANPSIKTGDTYVTLVQPKNRSEMLEALRSSEGAAIVLGHVALNKHKLPFRQ